MAKNRTATMAKEPNRTAQKAAAEAAGIEPTTFERMLEDMRQRPKFWGMIGVVAFVLVLLGIFGLHYFRSKRAETRDQIGEVLQAGSNLGTEADERLRRLQENVSLVDGTDQAPYYWVLVSDAAHQAAREAEDPKEKLEHYRACLSACQKLLNDYPKTPWVTLPWKSPGPQETATSLVQRRADYCQKQIDWLEQHADEVGKKPEPDPGVTATLTLEDPEGQQLTLPFRVYSSQAPYAVDQFFRNAREDRWKGTTIFGAQRDDPNIDKNTALLMGSPLSRYPDRHDVHGSEKDWPGFTLPLENSRLEPHRGALAFDLRRENNQVVGVSPSRLVLYLTDDVIRAADRLVFGELVDADEALKRLADLEPGDERLAGIPPQVGDVYPLAKTWKIVGVTTEGSPANPPPVPLQAEWIEPAKPEPLPDEKAPEPGQDGSSEKGQAPTEKGGR